MGEKVEVKKNPIRMKKSASARHKFWRDATEWTECVNGGASAYVLDLSFLQKTSMH